MSRKQAKALKNLNRYLTQRGELVLSREVVLAAITQRVEGLAELGDELEMDDSPLLGMGETKLYAWRVQDIVRELRFLVGQL